MVILIVLADRGMDMELLQATEKSMVFLTSQKLEGRQHEDALFCIFLKKPVLPRLTAF
jgi:hypothetical protein